MLYTSIMKEKISLVGTLNLDELKDVFKKVIYRGVYNDRGYHLKPYDKARFSFVKVLPAKSISSAPTIVIGKEKKELFSPQPTIYKNQIEVVKTVDEFLKQKGMRVNKMNGAIEYNWEGRGMYHMLPPIIEKHSIELKNGYFDLDKLCKVFKGVHVKDAQGNLHHLGDRYLKNYYIDEVSCIKHMDIFHSNASLINYGLSLNGKFDFYIVCDGMHRIDYSIEQLNEPINAILAESSNSHLLPYYAFPMPYRPTIRISSKQAEKMYPRIERDKVHLFNDFINKVLHYDWSPTNLNISRLRSNTNIF